MSTLPSLHSHQPDGMVQPPCLTQVQPGPQALATHTLHITRKALRAVKAELPTTASTLVAVIVDAHPTLLVLAVPHGTLFHHFHLFIGRLRIIPRIQVHMIIVVTAMRSMI